MLTRRHATRILGATALAGVTGLKAMITPARAADPSSADLAMAGPLGDVWLGSADAKCTIIEYASMTCTHCAAFHRLTWPKLKSTYIDTGKVHFTLREFPLDPLASAGFMLARCAGNDKYFAMTDLLFDKQDDWAFVKKPLESLASLTKQAGFTQKSFEECLKNQEKYDGEMNFEAMDKIIAPIVNA
jgi:protein-disulfide isomerase